MTSPATFAASEFQRRQSLARAMVAQGRMALDVAEAKLRPWLAIAAAAGADLPELWEEANTWRPGSETRPRGWQVERHRLRSWEIADRAEWQETLAKARDAALNDPANAATASPYAYGITTLAAALHCRPPVFRQKAEHHERIAA